MSRCYTDTNFLFVHLRQPATGADPAVERWRGRVLDEIDGGSAAFSALVIDELAYRLILAWLRDGGEPDPLTAYRRDGAAITRSMAGRLGRIWRRLDAMQIELVVTDEAVVNQAKALMSRPGLSPRDAFHAAHAIKGACASIASADAGFDAVKSLRRLGP